MVLEGELGLCLLLPVLLFLLLRNLFSLLLSDASGKSPALLCPLVPAPTSAQHCSILLPNASPIHPAPKGPMDTAKTVKEMPCEAICYPCMTFLLGHEWLWGGMELSLDPSASSAFISHSHLYS